MKVLHLGKFYAPAKGGMETVLSTVCEGTSSAVHNRVMVGNTAWRTVEERRDGVDVVRVGAVAKIGSLAICPAMPLRLLRETADVVVIHEPNPMGLLAYYLARPRAALIVWFHSEVIRPSWKYRLFYRPLFEFAMARASAVIVATPTLAATAPQLRPWQSKCVVIPYGVDAGAEPGEEVRARAAELRRQHAAPIAVFVGRLVPYKGVDVLLEALRGTGVVALLVGDGPLKATLERRARELGVEAQVHFLGAVDSLELAALYSAADLLVLPSVTRQEAFGVVQIEAMGRGKPVVSTSLGTGVEWVNQHGESGLVVPPGDAGALRDAICRISSDAAYRDALGANGAFRARSIFSTSRMVAAALNLFKETATSGPYPRQSFSKRALDITLAGAGLIISSPLWAGLAALIKLEDGGPVFFSQERVGLGGRRFSALKFRSMIPDAEAQVGAIQASERDARVTRVGRIMRATAMDELPQLWNIFCGDMSFVGPRALRPGEIEVNGTGVLERLEDVPGFEARCLVRPGLTGIAQVYAPRDVVRRKKFRYDRLYVRRQSFALDLRLILLSFWITFRGAWEVRGRKF